MGRGGEGRASRTSVKAFNFIVYAVTLNIDYLDPLFNVLTLCYHSYAKICWGQMIHLNLQHLGNFQLIIADRQVM